MTQSFNGGGFQGLCYRTDLNYFLYEISIIFPTSFLSLFLSLESCLQLRQHLFCKRPLCPLSAVSRGRNPSPQSRWCHPAGLHVQFQYHSCLYHPRIMPQSSSLLLDIQILPPSNTIFPWISAYNPLLLLRFPTVIPVSRVPSWHGLALSIVSIGIEIENLNPCEFFTSCIRRCESVLLLCTKEGREVLSTWKLCYTLFCIWIFQI